MKKCRGEWQAGVPSTNFEEVGAVVSNFEIRISNFGAIALAAHRLVLKKIAK